MSDDARTSHLGELLVLHSPSPWQTVVGMTVSLVGAVILMSVAIVGWGLNDSNRGAAAVVAIVCVGLAWVIYRQRRWRFAIFANGVTQIQANRIEEMLWADMREVVQTKLEGSDTWTTQVELIGHQHRIIVNPINDRRRKELFQSIVEQATMRNIAVRIEWHSTN